MKTKNNYYYALAVLALFASTYIFARKFSYVTRPDNVLESILVNPSGTCMLNAYRFTGSQAWAWLDPHALLTQTEGNAFYTVVEIKTGKVIRDSTTSLIPIPAYSWDAPGMQDSMIYWSKDGKTAAFPDGDGPAHEWTGLEECGGNTPRSEYANMSCRTGDMAPLCEKLHAETMEDSLFY